MSAKNILFVLLFIFISIGLINCSCNCDDAIADLKGRMGEPDDVESYSSSDYHQVTYWYWSSGIAYTFEWGENVSGCCDESTYSFTPFYGEITEDIKALIQSEMKLSEKRLHTDGAFFRK